MEHNPCDFPDCGKKRLAKGLCSGHYKQLRKNIQLRPLRSKKWITQDECEVEDCKRETYSKGLCKSHYETVRKGNKNAGTCSKA